MRSLVRLLALTVSVCTIAIGTSSRPYASAQPAAGSASAGLAQVSGTLVAPGLNDEVKVIRDKWGVPHIYAKNQDDLFFAQGFVQAQDRLFQMDLWRRSTQGHLAEILGPDYLERDRFSRLLKYRGDMDAEWNSYAPDAKRIIEQFVRGINAQVAIARKNLPYEFTLTGYEPALWAPEDILSRSEGFTMTRNVTAELFRAQLTAAIGAEQAARVLPPDPKAPVPVPAGLDLQLIDRTLVDIAGQIGTGASGRGADLVKLRAANDEDQAPDTSEEGSNNWVVSGAKSVTGHPLVANDPHRALDHPSLRYVVHLNAPGWNVIGANQPWLPGVSFGHNDKVAWGCTIFPADVQDLYVERINPANPRQYEYKGKWIDFQTVKDSVAVKGQAQPAQVELLYTHHGPVIAVNAAKHVAFALRWVGTEPGTAGYLAGIGLDRAKSAADLRSELKRWKVPGENFVYADVDGNIGYQGAALTPVRKNWTGLLPVPGWDGTYEWAGWFSLDDLPHESNPARGYIATANHNTLPPGETRVIGYDWNDPARINRIREVLSATRTFGIEDFERLQHDSVAWNAEQLVPLLAKLTADTAEVEQARTLLVGWNKDLTKDSAAAALYVVWEQRLNQGLAANRVPAEFAREYAAQATRLLVPRMTSPSADWFGGNPVAARDQLLLSALAAAVAELKGLLGADMGQWKWGALHAATFQHPLATTPEARALLNVGPIPRAGYALTPFNTGGRGFDQSSGSSYRHVMDVQSWDRSVATSAPGQSGQPGSPHYADLAKLWGEHQYFPLSFTEPAVQRNAEATLTLTPGGRVPSR